MTDGLLNVIMVDDENLDLALLQAKDRKGGGAVSAAPYERRKCQPYVGLFIDILFCASFQEGQGRHARTI